jgi:hypothetical protein
MAVAELGPKPSRGQPLKINANLWFLSSQITTTNGVHENSGVAMAPVGLWEALPLCDGTRCLVSFYSVVSTIANHNSARKLKSRCSVVSQVWFSSVYLCSDLCLYSEVLCYLVEMIENIAQEDWIPILKASEDHLKVIKIWHVTLFH